MLVFIAAAPLVLLATALAVWQGSFAARAAATLAVSFVSVAGAFAYALRLERQERERQRAAEVRRAAAESADHSKDVFLATLSHELRGALTAVIGWLDVARSSLDERTTLVRALDTALRNANQQARIIEDLLDVSRIVAGKFAVRRYPIELGRLAREALEAWQPEAAVKRIELHARVHEPVFVEGDRERLLQVMSNLIGNAIKFNRPGGWVELSLSQAGRDVRLEVSDNGSGIAREAMPHIFERFWQAPSRARRAGLGLGLPLVHHIVELHEGRVAAESRGPGQGARFSVLLPGLTEREQALAAGAHEPEEARPSLHGLGVVAVDEDEDTLGWLQHLFARHGAMTWTAHSAAEAIDQLSRVHPDVVVSGMAITGQEARWLIRALHAPQAAKPVAALAFSREPTDEERDGALAAGYDGFVAKPCDPGVLVRAVRAVVERAGA
jgi:signal transduction histidine kinase/CheY-like chemotaxis protein